MANYDRFASSRAYQRQRLMDTFLEMARKKAQGGPVQTPMARNVAGYYGFVGGGESVAGTTPQFTAERTRKAQYGEYGKGGIEREKVSTASREASVKALNEAKKLQLREREVAAKELEAEAKARGVGEFGVGALPAVPGTVPAATAPTLQTTGRPIGAPAPTKKEAPKRTPTMAVPPGNVQEGLGMPPEQLNIMNMPEGGGMITRRRPGGGKDYYWMNRAGQMGRQTVAAPEAQRPPATGWRPAINLPYEAPPGPTKQRKPTQTPGVGYYSPQSREDVLSPPVNPAATRALTPETMKPAEAFIDAPWRFGRKRPGKSQYPYREPPKKQPGSKYSRALQWLWWR